MNLITKSIGVLVTALAIGVSIGPDMVGMFYDERALTLVTGLILGGLILTHGFAAMRDAAIDIFKAKHERGTERLGETVAVLSHAAFFATIGGTLGGVIGFVVMLANLSDPSQLGPAMSVALLSLFYGIVLSALVFVPMRGALIKKYDAYRSDSAAPGLIRGIQSFSLFSFFALVTIFWVLMANPKPLVHQQSAPRLLEPIR